MNRVYQQRKKKKMERKEQQRWWKPSFPNMEYYKMTRKELQHE